MATVGQIEQFDGSNFEDYEERLNAYFEANKIGQCKTTDSEEDKMAANKMKLAVTISLIGRKTYATLKDLCVPDKPQDKTFTEVCALLRDYYKPRVLEVAETYRFHRAEQQDNESVQEYANRLRKMASTCNFGEYLARALRDQFVGGVRNAAIKKKLLAADRTFHDALAVAIADETAEGETKNISASPEEEVAAVKFVKKQAPRNRPKQMPHYSQKQAKKAYACHRCNKTDHNPDECRHKKSVCHFCNRRGHIIAACRSKGSSSVNNLQDVPDENEEDEEDIYDMYSTSLEGGQKVEPISVDIEIGIGQKVTMEVDTGASVSIISEQTYLGFKNPPPLKKSVAMLRTYTGSLIPTLGSFEADIRYAEQEANLPIIVVKGNGPNLMGRNILKKIKLRWEDIFKCDATNKLDTKPQCIRTKYKAVFEPGLGTFKGQSVEIHLKEGTVPKFMKSRPVTFALQEKVNRKLEQMIEEGSLEPVTASNWASPIVPVVQGDSVRITGDYKRTVNPATIVDVYPVPDPKAIWAKLNGGKKFSRLDIAQAYMQFPLDEESQEIATLNTPKGLMRVKKLPQGINSAPGIFLREMDKLLGDLPKVIVFYDDILITGENEKAHDITLNTVLTRLQEAGLRLNLKKCKFFADEVEFLAHKVTSRGIQPVEEKVKAIHNAPTPTSRTELKAYLGLITHYGKFMPNLATVTAPLNLLLRKEQKWHWGPAQDNAFITTKQMIDSDRVLTHYDPNKPLLLITDASPVGVGCVLAHECPDGERPIAFASHTL
jgi:hypothetical protein